MNDKKLTEEDIYFGYEYCAICGRPLSLNEEDLCAECSFKKVCKVKKENERLKENIMQMFSTNDIIDEKMDKLRIKNKTLKAKLEIAVQALEELSNETLVTAGGGCYANTAYDRAQKALAKIKEIKG